MSLPVCVFLLSGTNNPPVSNSTCPASPKLPSAEMSVCSILLTQLKALGAGDHRAERQAKISFFSSESRWYPATPVCVKRYDAHEFLANLLARKLAGISKHAPDPPGDVIVGDGSMGEPTGVLKDTTVAAIERIVPRPNWDEFEAALRAGLVEVRRYGDIGT